MDAELLVAGESLEMPTGPPRTLGVGELGEVTVPTAEANSVLTTVLWVCIRVVFQLPL
jgi:hypothetical protein